MEERSGETRGLIAAPETLELKDPEPETVMGFLNEMEFRTLTKRVAERLKIDAPVLEEAKGMHVEGAHDAAPAVQQLPFDHAGYECIRDLDTLNGWIARINAGAHVNGLSYSRMIDGLKKSGVIVNRKILSDLAIHDAAGFAKLCETAKAGLGK